MKTSVSELGFNEIDFLAKCAGYQIASVNYIGDYTGVIATEVTRFQFAVTTLHEERGTLNQPVPFDPFNEENLLRYMTRFNLNIEHFIANVGGVDSFRDPSGSIRVNFFSEMTSGASIIVSGDELEGYLSWNRRSRVIMMAVCNVLLRARKYIEQDWNE